MDIFLPTIEFIASLDFGENFFVLTSFCLLLLTTLLLLLSLIFKRIRNLNKTIILGFVITAYLLCIAKIVCQIYITNKIPFCELVICSVLAPIQAFVLVCISLLRAYNLPNFKDNEVIGGFFEEKTLRPTQATSPQLVGNPFKKVERLKTKKMFETSDDTSNVNYSYILKRIDELDDKKLSIIEKSQVFNLKNMIEKYAHSDINEKEKEYLCDGIRKFLKISAKYDEFSPDVF